MPETTIEQLTQRLDLDALARDYGKKPAEKDYVYVDGDNMQTPPSTSGSEDSERYSDTLSIESTERWEKQLMQDPKNRLALSALSGTDPKQVLTQRSAQIADTQSYNIKISLEGAPITNQRSSGRCWLFAACNVFRVAIMRRYNLKEFELSQSYLFFWDKLEKANYFLEQIIDTVDEPLDGRLIQELLSKPVQDGGQWDMAANLVEKYGLVPQHLYPDSHNAMNSSTMATLITTKLREDALEIRDLSRSADLKASIGAVKENMMREIHRILTIMLGPPPSPTKEITWEYYDKEDKFGTLTTTPLDFAAELHSKESKTANSGADIHELFSLVNDPRNAYGQLLSVSRLGNVVGLRGIRYINVDMTTMKTACVAMLKANLPIFFGSDVGKFSDSKSGIMDMGLIDYELGFNIRLGLTKAQRLETGESAMTHAMVLTAVHVDAEGKPVRWRVQNSWGENPGTKGWFVMSDGWMDQFVYQAVVDPEFVSQETRDVLKNKPKMLELWDPMGALA
ncbi:bleomycin hydrolase [Lecanora helva]